MDIRVNRFKVKHQGNIYGPGDVIYGIDASEGQKLVDESNGELEKLPSQVEQAEDGQADVLSPVDPLKTVK
jgi:hypothetical protein